MLFNGKGLRAKWRQVVHSSSAVYSDITFQTQEHAKTHEKAQLHLCFSWHLSNTCTRTHPAAHITNIGKTRAHTPAKISFSVFPAFSTFHKSGPRIRPLHLLDFLQFKLNAQFRNEGGRRETRRWREDGEEGAWEPWKV